MKDTPTPKPGRCTQCGIHRARDAGLCLPCKRAQ